METIGKLRETLIEYLRKYAKEKPINPDEGVSFQIIIDQERGHYQLMRVGWFQGRYIHNCLIHFNIRNEKVWIMQNNTEKLVADELIQLGLVKSDIVLGFRPKEVRQYTGFAEA
ncbi:MAG: XisI protein [Bacteroidota bacterium]